MKSRLLSVLVFVLWILALNITRIFCCRLLRLFRSMSKQLYYRQQAGNYVLPTFVSLMTVKYQQSQLRHIPLTLEATPVWQRWLVFEQLDMVLGLVGRMRLGHGFSQTRENKDLTKKSPRIVSFFLCSWRPHRIDIPASYILPQFALPLMFIWAEFKTGGITTSARWTLLPQTFFSQYNCAGIFVWYELGIPVGAFAENLKKSFPLIGRLFFFGHRLDRRLNPHYRDSVLDNSSSIEAVFNPWHLVPLSNTHEQKRKA